MASIKSSILLSLWMFLDIAAQDTEYCTGEVFEPECGNEKLIIMESALYGRMDIGRCIPHDHGNMGCRADVLSTFDGACSGRTTCQVRVTDPDIEPVGGCEKGLYTYLQANYVCKKELAVTCAATGPANVQITEPEVYLSSDSIHNSCFVRSKALTLQANDGQTMNISLINLQQSHRDAVYGTLKDSVSNTRVVFGDGPRHSNLLIGSSHLIEMLIQNSEARFILKITVSGCPNISPPNDAWMTREGDTMEVGCHSGDKSWTLKCENNQWVGAVGQCGRDVGRQTTLDDAYETTKDTISPNVVVFGICSLIILLSVIIFLTGVCLLKRSIQARRANIPPGQKSINPPAGLEFDNQAEGLIRGYPDTMSGHVTSRSHAQGEPGYKSLQAGYQYRDGTAQRGQSTGAPPPAYSTYMNSGASDASDSVKYYVLEDVARDQHA